MITISAALKAHLAQGAQTCCTILKITRADTNVYGFTDSSVDIAFTDGVTYKAGVGYTRKDVEGKSDLSTDNTEYDGILSSPSITEADLTAGLWDFADVELSLINWADFTMGRLILRTGKLGQVTVLRNQFTGEIRGMLQALSRTIGELTQPGCRAQLYDARCKVDPAAFTVSSTLTGVSADQLVLFDTARTEPGPTGGLTITAITAANPAVFSVASVASLILGEAIMLSGIAGSSAAWATLNAQTVVKSIDTTLNQFTTSADTSAFTGSYTASSGTVTPLGSNSGYFDFGLITFTSGLCVGLSMEVKSYVVGQWTLELPMPYALAIGDAYTMLAGCDKSFATCKTKFANVVNMRGEPYLPGLDKLVQVGKQVQANDT